MTTVTVTLTLPSPNGLSHAPLRGALDIVDELNRAPATAEIPGLPEGLVAGFYPWRNAVDVMIHGEELDARVYRLDARVRDPLIPQWFVRDDAMLHFVVERIPETALLVEVRHRGQRHVILLKEALGLLQ